MGAGEWQVPPRSSVPPDSRSWLVAGARSVRGIIDPQGGGGRVMPRVYVAGPLESGGDQLANVHRALDAASELLEAGCAPYVPHLTWHWHLRRPQPLAVWLRLDRAWLECCDALVRLPGVSAGADAEVRTALQLRIPVYYTVAECVDGLGLRGACTGA